jgi:hypothetical protein
MMFAPWRIFWSSNVGTRFKTGSGTRLSASTLTLMRLPDSGTGGMMRHFRSLIFGVAFLAGAVSAQAETLCAQHDKLVTLLESKYGEQQAGYGLVGTRSMLEVFVSEKHSFTIISTHPNGFSCIVAAGDNWEAVEPKKKLTSM